jgi:hypothetical protein
MKRAEIVPRASEHSVNVFDHFNSGNSFISILAALVACFSMAIDGLIADFRELMASFQAPQE